MQLTWTNHLPNWNNPNESLRQATNPEPQDIELACKLPLKNGIHMLRINPPSSGELHVTFGSDMSVWPWIITTVA